MADILQESVPIALVAMLVLIVWLRVRRSMNENRIRAELQKEVLAKFTSGQELSDFLATDAGKQFMKEPGSRWVSKGRVITLAVWGLVSIGAGAGFYIGGEDPDAAGLFTGVGVALLLSSVVSYWLAKKLGLSDTPVDSTSR